MLTTYSLSCVFALYKCIQKGERRPIERRATFHGVEMVAQSNEPAERHHCPIASSAVCVTDCRFRLEPSAMNNQDGALNLTEVFTAVLTTQDNIMVSIYASRLSLTLPEQGKFLSCHRTRVFDYDSPGSQAGKKMRRYCYSLPWTSLLYSWKRPKRAMKIDYIRSGEESSTTTEFSRSRAEASRI
jgi:hypothetical protein